MTAEKVAQWLKSPRWKNANVALRAEGFLGIDVDHYDGKEGMTDLFELEQKLGELPATPSNTARGDDSPSRQYFFRIPDGFEAVSKLSNAIEVIQGHHRYAVVHPSIHGSTGTEYKWYDASGAEMWGLPSINDFAELPEAWLNYMRADQHVERKGFGGTVDDWLGTLPDGAPTETVQHLIDSLPHDGFTHDDVIKIIWRLVRLGAEGHSGIRWALETIEDTWVKPPYDTETYVKELEVAIAGAISKAGAPEWPEPLPKADLLPLVEKHDGLEEWVWGSKQRTDPNRRKLIQHLYEIGLNRHEILSFVWHSNQNVFEHPADLWDEVKDFEPVEENTGGSFGVSLLSDRERKHLEYVPNFIDLYQKVASLREENPNLPYHRANAWTILSILFSPLAMIPAESGDLGLNLYVLIMGETTSGKGMAKSQLKQVLRQAVGEEAYSELNIGGAKTSPEGLSEVLIQRDGKVSWFNTDEAAGVLNKMSDKGGYQAALEYDIADYYEGEVNAYHKKGSKETSGKSAKTHFVMWLQGTEVGVLSNLYPRQIESGFVARFVTAFGNPRQITNESLEFRQQSDDEIALGKNPYITQLGKELAYTAESVAAWGQGQPYRILSTPEALSRLTKARIEMFKPYAQHKLADLIEPVLVRMSLSMWKAAGLIALSRESKQIELDDALIAIRQGEEWLANLVRLIEGIASSEWTQQVERVFEWIKSHGGSVSKALTYRQFNDKMDFELDNITRSLLNQKRIRDNQKEGTWDVIE